MLDQPAAQPRTGRWDTIDLPSCYSTAGPTPTDWVDEFTPTEHCAVSGNGSNVPEDGGVTTSAATTWSPTIDSSTTTTTPTLMNESLKRSGQRAASRGCGRGSSR